MAVLVYVEDHEGELNRSSLGVLSRAAKLGDEVAAVLCGSGVKELAARTGSYGASRAYVVEDPALEHPLPQPRVDVLARLIEDQGFDTVVFGASVLTADVAAGLAVRLDAGLNWDLVDPEVGWRSEPRLALIRSGTFEPQESGGEAEVEEIGAEIQDFSRQAVMIESAHAESEGPSIEDADVIVAGGRGLGDPKNFSLVEDLAKALGGAVAATRAVVDAGWYPYASQVGQTGKNVSPKLYVACGISGAIQHKVGMQSAGTIVAINKDPNAPIFEYSDLGVVGDLHEIVPKLTQLVKERKGG
jgi:electron transfer flavoprotein alpha subunit